MAAEQTYDAIVIGAGQGGKPLSMILAKAGLKTAVVEDRPKARFGNRRLPVVSRPEASILKETIRPIVKRTGGPINWCMPTRWKICGGGKRSSADPFNTASLEKISRRKE